jgi:hypothetical protein
MKKWVIILCLLGLTTAVLSANLSISEAATPTPTPSPSPTPTPEVAPISFEANTIPTGVRSGVR